MHEALRTAWSAPEAVRGDKQSLAGMSSLVGTFDSLTENVRARALLAPLIADIPGGQAAKSAPSTGWMSWYGRALASQLHKTMSNENNRVQDSPAADFAARLMSRYPATGLLDYTSVFGTAEALTPLGESTRTASSAPLSAFISNAFSDSEAPYSTVEQWFGPMEPWRSQARPEQVFYPVCGASECCDKHSDDSGELVHLAYTVTLRTGLGGGDPGSKQLDISEEVDAQRGEALTNVRQQPKVTLRDIATPSPSNLFGRNEEGSGGETIEEIGISAPFLSTNRKVPVVPSLLPRTPDDEATLVFTKNGIVRRDNKKSERKGRSPVVASEQQHTSESATAGLPPRPRGRPRRQRLDEGPEQHVANDESRPPSRESPAVGGCDLPPAETIGCPRDDDRGGIAPPQRKRPRCGTATPQPGKNCGRSGGSAMRGDYNPDRHSLPAGIAALLAQLPLEVRVAALVGFEIRSTAKGKGAC